MTIPHIANLERAVQSFLAREPIVTPTGIRSWISQFRMMPMCSVNDGEAEALARRFEARHGVTMSMGAVLTERDYRPWLEARVAGIDFYYWNRYRQLLLQDKKLSIPVVTTLNADTDRTLGLLQDPTKDGPWKRRGMVVGHVQSGKTANYIGLMSKAADAGYRLIVVIAGVHNNLRNQTQKRIDEGFIGRDSSRILSQKVDWFIGVGRYDQRRRPATFTNSVRDFNKAMATGLGMPLQNLNEPAVFVIKKNVSTLRNLVEWLREHNAARGATTVDSPMLLIDDEADNASIDVGKPGETSRINALIRELLQLFSRSCYVGYTATPFANIFIDPDTDDEMLGEDLFPRDFIISLDPPSNYFGADRVFGDDMRSVIRYIDDNDDRLPLRHKIDFTVAALPRSLEFAVRTFIVGRAIRLLRGQRVEHCSMLVNASRFTRIQGQIASRIQALLVDIKSSVRVNGALPPEQAARDPEIRALFDAYQSEFPDTVRGWDNVQAMLLDAVSPIKVVEVNNRSHGNLNYGDYEATGLCVIAVGGYALSRGLTLEGLMVSYFLRNSMMYDTLMQMGRWFGYRDGYDDLCRVWMPEEAEGWYVHIADSIEMLREELRVMAAAGATPKEFGLKVRAHPDVLLVTARNKMGSSERVVVSIGLAKQFVETATLKSDPGVLDRHRSAVNGFVSTLHDAGVDMSASVDTSGGWLLKGVPVGPVRAFLSAFDNHPLSMLTERGPLQKYIAAREEDELALWDLFVPSVGSAEETLESRELFGIQVRCQRRTVGERSDASTLRITNKQRVASRGVEKAGLTSEEIAAAQAAFDQEPAREGKKTQNYPDRIYRAVRRRPLLVLHLLNLLGKDGVPLYERPVVAWSISFPSSLKDEQRVEYVVNTTWLRENFSADSDEELEQEDAGA